MVYCVMPSHMTARVRRTIERSLRDRDGIEVVEERREGDRRRGSERRSRTLALRPGSQRRRIRYAEGRRVAERRAVLVPVAAPGELPRAARQHAASLSFIEPLEVPVDFRADVEAVRAIVRYQSGEGEVAELYGRWFEPVYTYLSVTMDRGADVEAQVAAALAEVLRQLPGVEPAPAQVRPWLFGIAHRAAGPWSLEQPLPRGRVNGHDHRLGENGKLEDAGGLEWLGDDELVLLVERRPPAERHLLVLRYFVGLSFTEIGTIMGIEAEDALGLHRSAVDSLEATLSAVTRSPRIEGRHPMGRLTHQTPVLHRRRRALLAT